MGCILRNSQDGFEGTRWAPFDPVLNGGTWGPSKWSKINGFHWGIIYFTLLIGVIILVITGRGPPCMVPGADSETRKIIFQSSILGFPNASFRVSYVA